MFSRIIKKFKILFWVLLLLIIGSIFRSWYFWTPSFRGDEAGNMIKAVRVARGLTDLFLLRQPDIALNNIFLPILQHNHPPLEFLILIPSVPFNPREFYARLIYILISIATIFFSYLALKKIKNKKFALYFLAIYSTSSYAIFLSQRVDYFLNMVAGLLIGISILNFMSKPTKISFRLLNLSYCLSLLISIDYIFFIPAYIYQLYFYRKKIGAGLIFKELIIALTILSVFYIPYVFYSFKPDSPKNAGFNYYISSYLRNNNISSSYSNFISDFKTKADIFWVRFLRLPGVLTIWPFSILGIIFYRKNRYVLVLTLIVVTIILLEYPFVGCCTGYLNIYPLLIILAVLWLVVFKKAGLYILILIVIINAFSTLLSFKSGERPIGFNLITTEDNIQKIAKIAKNCLRDNETYISTDDSWRTQYYFGKGMLPDLEVENISDEQAVIKFLNNELPYNISFVHIGNNRVSQMNIKKLEAGSINTIAIGNDKLFIFKQCIN